MAIHSPSICSHSICSRCLGQPDRPGSTITNLDYDYVFHAKSQAAVDDLTAYAASHDGTISIIKGFAKFQVIGTGYAFASASGGAATFASYSCSDNGGDCLVPKKPNVFKFTIAGAFTISDTKDRSFLGHISLSSSANAFGPKSKVYGFIDPEIGPSNDFGGSASDFSEGVGNMLGTGNIAVPEPASWMMLISGFGLVGALARSRRAVTAKAATAMRRRCNTAPGRRSGPATPPASARTR